MSRPDGVDSALSSGSGLSPFSRSGGEVVSHMVEVGNGENISRKGRTRK